MPLSPPSRVLFVISAQPPPSPTKLHATSALQDSPLVDKDRRHVIFVRRERMRMGINPLNARIAQRDTIVISLAWVLVLLVLPIPLPIIMDPTHVSHVHLDTLRLLMVQYVTEMAVPLVSILINPIFCPHVPSVLHPHSHLPTPSYVLRATPISIIHRMGRVLVYSVRAIRDIRVLVMVPR